MNFIDKEIENYCVDKSSWPSSLCQSIQDYTLDQEHWSQMLTGKMEASFLGFLIRAIGATRVLEFGTFTGYSALSMAENLPEHGEIITIDNDSRIQKIAQGFWDKSAHGKKIKPILSNGIEALEKIQGEFDFVFIDADKVNYKNYLSFSLSRLSKKGIVALDNMLWSGRVLTNEQEKSTQAIKELNDYIASRDDLFKTLLPIRDGIFLVQKLS